MFIPMKKSLLAASVCLGALLPFAQAVMAQEAIIVMASNQVGAPTYNPIKGTIMNTANSLIYDRLVAQDAKRKYHPQLAESWEEATDGMSWVFHLKKGVTFHNGVPFNAQTVADWIPLFVGSENGYLTAGIEKVEVIDEQTVKFVMAHPDPNLLYNLASSFMGVPEPKAFVEMGDDFGVTEAIGTGPYKLESFAIEIGRASCRERV